MKKITILVVMLAVGFTAVAENGRLIPDINVGGGKLSIQGFANGVFSSDNTGPETMWANLRVTTDYKNGRLILHNVTNFADMQAHDGNWLREMTVGWKVNDQMTISAGRLFLSGGMSAPGPSNLETIVYPASYPFNCYAYGVQGVWSSERWTIMGGHLRKVWTFFPG